MTKTLKKFEAGDFVVNAGDDRPMMVVNVESASDYKPMNLDRLTLQTVTGAHYHNMPAYLMRDATEAEVVAALEAAGVEVGPD